jgi:hypothetical protein
MEMEMEDCCVEGRTFGEDFGGCTYRRIEKLGMGNLCSVDGCGNGNDLW